MQTILVTGAAGFIGSHVAKALLEAGHSVVGIDNINDYYDQQLKHDRLGWLNKYPAFTFYELDFSDRAATRSVFEKHTFDRICHLGARAGVRPSLENPFIYEQANTQGTLNLLDLAREFDIKYFVLASTSSVYGANNKVPFSETDAVDHPVSPYAATKRACELMAYTYHHLYGINTIILRFFTVYGPWGRPDMAYFKFAQAITQGQPIDVYNNGDHQRDFTYIDDIVSGVTSALTKDYGYEIINLGNSHTEELMYMIECIEKEFGATFKKNMVAMQAGDVHRTYADITKAKELLGYNPQTRLSDGLHKFAEWYKEYYSKDN